LLTGGQKKINVEEIIDNHLRQILSWNTRLLTWKNTVKNLLSNKREIPISGKLKFML